MWCAKKINDHFTPSIRHERAARSVYQRKPCHCVYLHLQLLESAFTHYYAVAHLNTSQNADRLLSKSVRNIDWRRAGIQSKHSSSTASDMLGFSLSRQLCAEGIHQTVQNAKYPHEAFTPWPCNAGRLYGWLFFFISFSHSQNSHCKMMRPSYVTNYNTSYSISTEKSSSDSDMLLILLRRSIKLNWVKIVTISNMSLMSAVLRYGAMMHISYRSTSYYLRWINQIQSTHSDLPAAAAEIKMATVATQRGISTYREVIFTALTSLDSQLTGCAPSFS